MRDALPFDQQDIRDLQHRLELTSDDLRAKRWSALSKAVSRSEALLNTRRSTVLEAIPDERRGRAEELFAEVQEGLDTLQERIGDTDKPGFIAARRSTLRAIGDVEALLVEDGFEREIPSAFDALPRLQGRATLTIKTTQGDLTAVADGYNAPITAGAFVDLALKGFYDGLPFTRAEDFYILQSGDPKAPTSATSIQPPSRNATSRSKSESPASQTPSTTRPSKTSACSRPPHTSVRHPRHPWLGPLGPGPG